MARAIKVNESAKLSTDVLDTGGKVTFDMSLRKMPKALREKFKRLKAEGKVTGSMNDYMRRAFMEQLKRDDI
uniref:Uncharacterized protein n=1 Tax=Vibrio splendidus TaxID=29497 RepID=A0A0H3ZJQ5_VIBSP|nr:hypothetical protein [Vibrio splendidus]